MNYKNEIANIVDAIDNANTDIEKIYLTKLGYFFMKKDIEQNR